MKIATLMVLVCAVAATKPGILLVEEPECFQHPASIELIASLFVTAVAQGTQVLATTHSLDFIDALVRAARNETTIPGLDAVAVLRLKLENGELSNIVFAGSKVETLRETAEFDLR